MKGLARQERIGALVLVIVVLCMLAVVLLPKCNPAPRDPAPEVVVLVPDTAGRSHSAAKQDSIKKIERQKEAEKKKKKKDKPKSSAKVSGSDKNKNSKGRQSEQGKPRSTRDEAVTLREH